MLTLFSTLIDLKTKTRNNVNYDCTEFVIPFADVFPIAGIG